MCINCYSKLSLTEALEKLQNTEFAEEEIDQLQNIMVRLDFFCKQCGKDTRVDDKDYYMVTHEVWKKHGEGEHMLCIDCLENRLGHKLTKEEILDCFLNRMINPYTIEILNS